ncbi:methyl-accepting chemotaxis protein [Planktothrix sp. FACHB-1365]|uniref:HAMP domain-containing methyl-accepting chemotaxis protein n=1 Tax=Planktothrix sp. FACHB-1365 TaxID=2692855 RepID=UPI0016891BBA|nr:methyl-accepting chemotaxis protein [Planktothrix sp. FACHB-1365]MBD2482621.1 MCP four helix bundle domain-containing protein [Planktothrix sp. FACHB-1365]
MKLGQKLYIGCGIPLVTLVIMGSYSLYSFQKIDHQVSTIYDDRVVPLQQLKIVSDSYAVDIVDSVNKVNANILSMEEALRSVNQAEIDIKEQWQAYKNTKLEVKEKQLVDETEKLFINANFQIQDLKQVLKERKKSEVYKFTNILYEVIDPVTQKLEELTRIQLEIAAEERQKSALIYQQTLQIFLPLLFLAILVGSPLGFFVIRRGIISTFETIINNIVVSSTEIAAVVDEQERLSLQQSSVVQQTKSLMESLNNAYQESYQKSEHTVFYAQESLNLIERNHQSIADIKARMDLLNQKVNQISEKMLNLQYHAEQISQISTLVSHIANQTNVLALNARIEWVRSDTQNQGFSIVASEIRDLANQSQKSASSIDILVNDIETAVDATVKVTHVGKEAVEQGVQMTHKISQTFMGMNEMMRHVVSDNQNSLNCAKDQERAIEQVVTGMNQLNRAVQETTAGISQVKIGMANLKIVADHLKSMV